MRKTMMVMGLALAACAAFAWPLPDEVAKVRPIVDELMSSKESLPPGEAADAASALADDAKTEAARYLLLRRAVELYAKAGDDEKTAAAFQKLLANVKDVPLTVQERILLSAGRTLPVGKRAKTESLFKGVRALVWADKELAAARRELKSTKKDAPEAHLRAGNALVVMGDWTNALAHLLGAMDTIASIADQEINGTAKADRLADAWWKASMLADETYVKSAYRLHSAELYRKALAANLLKGLNKSLAEGRVAEVEKENATDPVALLASIKKAEKPLYCIVDLSGGPSASSYPVLYAPDVSDVPGGTFNVDEYKTTKLVLRRIEPGTFKMCGEYDVTITKPYYIGVFEVTQKQYELVTGEKPSRLQGDKRPVEHITYDMMRGKGEGAKWPSSSAVDAYSFMGRLRARTKIDFDLPTEAQWEYACRAGTTSEYNNGGNSESDLKQLGRYRGNQSDGRGGYSANHTVVGSYQPNAWGLYDMHGNVWESCLDWRGDLSSGVKDPKGSSSGEKGRVLRGGGWLCHAGDCRSAHRHGKVPRDRYFNDGFRLCCPAELRGSVEPTKPVAKPQPTQDMSGTRRTVQLWEGGPYWAEMNIGATKPEESGYYFWWGDTIGYKRENDAWMASDGTVGYKRENGAWVASDGSVLPFGKTCHKNIDKLKSEGWISEDGVLAPEHDAAHVHWGGNWRMPTKQEADDLVKKCDWTRTTQNGVNGYVVKGRGVYSSASIFLPSDSNTFSVYWLSAPHESNGIRSWGLEMGSKRICRNEFYRAALTSIRPVQSVAK